MKPIQNQYQDLLEGKMSKHNFLNNVKSTLSQYVSKGNSYEDAISILKSKRILSEVKPNEIETVQDEKGNFTKRIKLSDKDKKTVGKVQALMAKEKPLKEMYSSSLKPNSSYEYSGGAETEILKYVGKRQDNPDIKVGSSMGKGHIFQWPDGKYFELGPISVMKYINKIDNEEDEEIINRYDREQEKHALPGGNIYESVEMPANLIADIDKVNPLEYNTGLDYELDLSGDFSAASLVKCAKKVVKNLKKNSIYYTNLKAELTQKINNKKVVSSEYTELKKDNQVDKLNQLKSIVKKEIANTKISLSKQEKASKAMPKGVKLMKEEKERAPKLSADLIQSIIQKSGGPRKDLYYTEDLKNGMVYVISKTNGIFDLYGDAKRNIEKYFDIEERSEKVDNDRYYYEYFISTNPSKPKPTQPKADIDLNTDDIFENNEKQRQEKDFSKFSEKMIGKKSTAQNTVKDKIKTYVTNSLKKEAVKFTIGASGDKEYMPDAGARAYEDKLKAAGVKFTKTKA